VLKQVKALVVKLVDTKDLKWLSHIDLVSGVPEDLHTP